MTNSLRLSYPRSRHTVYCDEKILLMATTAAFVAGVAGEAQTKVTPQQAAKSKQAQQYSAAIGALNSLRAMLVQPQLDRQFEAHFRGRFTHQGHRRA